MQSKALILLAQVFISMMMAFLMSGIMGAISLGLTEEWLRVWPRAFVTSWPIAFVLSLFVGPAAFWMASRVLRLPRR